MKQTAVEWLEIQLFKKQGEFNKSDIEQALEMEKEHLCDFYMRGGYNAIFQSNQKFDDLYNETFKSE